MWIAASSAAADTQSATFNEIPADVVENAFFASSVNAVFIMAAAPAAGTSARAAEGAAQSVMAVAIQHTVTRKALRFIFMEIVLQILHLYLLSVTKLLHLLRGYYSK